MQIGKLTRAALFASAVALQAVPAMAAHRPAEDGEFPIKLAPSKADWHTFIQATEAERRKLWGYQTSRGRHLGDWSWGWRLGWVRVCGRSEAPYCGGVLQEALLDKAVVVRAEAASALGRLYEHTANPAVVRVLAGAYPNSRNWRHGKPLFVQQRILYALHQIGGAAALEAGAALAGQEKAAVTYWHQLDQSKAW